jgi:hypothetical protein
MATITRLTWQGYEFLDATRDARLWMTTKGIMQRVKDVTFATAAAVAHLITKQAVQKAMSVG